MNPTPQAQPSKPSIRAISLVGLADVTLSLIVIATLTAFAGRWWWLVDLASHFRLQFFAFALLLGAFYGFKRQRVRTGIAAGAALVNLIVLQPHLMSSETSAAKTGVTRARVIWWNVQAGNQKKKEAVDWINQSAADLVALGEITPSWETALESIHETYPYRYVEARSDNFGIALYSRIPLYNSTTIAPTPESVPTLRTELQLQGRIITLFVTHPLPPMGHRPTKERNAQLEWLAAQVGKASSALVLGDLNTTPWNHAFQRFVKNSKLQNSDPTWIGTWPTKMLPLRIPIDHCLSSKDMILGSKEWGPTIGSDHSPIQAHLKW